MHQSDYLPDDLKALWTELSARPFQVAPYQLRKESEKLQAALRRRSLIGTSVAWMMAASFAVLFFVFPTPMERTGSILTIAGAVYLLVQLRMRPARRMAEVGETDCVLFYRSELERQRDFHRGGWFWSRMLMFLPGPFLFGVGFALSHPRFAPLIWLDLVIVAILSAVAVRMNLRLARQYQRRIDNLDNAVKENRQ